MNYGVTGRERQFSGVFDQGHKESQQIQPSAFNLQPFYGGKSQNHSSFVYQHIEGAIGTGADIPDAPGFPQDDFFFDNIVSVEDEPDDLLMFEEAHEEIVFPGGEKRAGGEFDAGNGGGGNPIMNGFDHAGQGLVWRLNRPVAIESLCG